MATLDKLRQKVSTARELLSIVRTLKILSAVNMRQLERCVASLDAYQRNIELGLQVVLREHFEIRPVPQPGSRSALVVFGSDHGLCGAFNQSMARYTAELISGLPSIYVVGGRLADEMCAAGHKPTVWCAAPNSVAGLRSVVMDALIQLDAWLPQRVVVVHHRVTGGLNFEPSHRQILPFSAEWLKDLMSEPWHSRSRPTFRTDVGKLLPALSRSHVGASIFRALAHSMAAENAARLLAMSAAEQNIGDRLEELRRDYDQQRQTSITQDMLEVLSGFQVINGAQ